MTKHFKKSPPSIVPPNIAGTSVSYRLLYIVASFFFRLFYRRFIVLNRHLVPKGEQLIYASNHQNALMDALAMLFAARRPVAFLARADMFRKKPIAHMLHFLKIMPIFRPRDGMENMNANYEVFQATARLLKKGMPIALLPEGTHSPIKKLQQLKKGICRIAFQAAEAQNYEADIFIVPTGIDYTSYSEAGTDLLLIYGPAINVAQYYPLYRENPQKAINALIQHLAGEIKKLMIHVEDDHYYDTIQHVTTFFASGNTRYANFKKARHLIQELYEVPEKEMHMEALKEHTHNYTKILRQKGFRDASVRIPASLIGLVLRFILALLLLPLALAGGIINFLPYKLPTLVSDKVKDKQFVASVNYGLGLLCFILWYLILLLVAVLLFKSVWAILLLLPAGVSGLFAFYYAIHLKKLKGDYNFYRFRKRDPVAYGQMLELRNDIKVLVPDADIDIIA
ncbi:hypothetical protein MASR1M74_19150 [Lentimicrobium sp.]